MKKENIEMSASWTEGPCECEYNINDHKIEAIVSVRCDGYKTAINYFKEIFQYVYNVDIWTETMIKKCADGQFKESKNLDCAKITDEAEMERLLEKDGSYRWNVSNYTNLWQVYLRLSGEYAGMAQDD